MKRKLKFNQAINEAIYQAMKSDKKIVCYGLGVTDPIISINSYSFNS